MLGVSERTVRQWVYEPGDDDTPEKIRRNSRKMPGYAWLLVRVMIDHPEIFTGR